MKRLGVVVAGLALAALPAAAQTWTELGPAPITNGAYAGRIAAIACSRTDPDRYYVGGADAGVWRTTDAGATWTPVTDQMPTTAIGALAVDPVDDRIVYAGTGEANFAAHSRYGLGFYKSSDGGDTWRRTAEATFGGRAFSRILVNPSNRDVLFAAITPAGGFPAAIAAKGHPGAAGPVGLFRSNDAGETWTQVLAGLPSQAATDVEFEPGNPLVMYCAIADVFGPPGNGIFKSVDGGANWTYIGGGTFPPPSMGRISLAVAPSAPQRVYALIAEPSDANGGSSSTMVAMRSDDAGANWAPLPLGNVQATYGWYNSVVGVDPGDSDVVFMGGLDLRRSRNAGDTWRTVTPPHVDVHALEWDAAGRLVCGNDGGVHRTSDQGMNWLALNDGLGSIQFYAGLSMHPTLADTLLGGSQDNGSLQRNGATRGWEQVFGGDGGWTQIDSSAPNREFVEYQGTGNLYFSATGGTGFVGVGAGIVGGDRNCFLPPFLIRPGDSTRMLYATHRVYQSTNGGMSWTPRSADLTLGAGAIRSLAISQSNPDVVYATTTDGNLQRSDDFGVNFTLVRSGLPAWKRTMRDVFVSPVDPRVVWLAQARFGVDQMQRSDDGGNAWTILDGDLPDTPVNTVAADVRAGGPVVFAGADDGVYWLRASGSRWRRLGIGLPHAAVIDLIVDVPRNRLIASTQGRGAWVTALPDPQDADGDTIPDVTDDCPDDPDPLQQDGDGDGVGDACDVCPLVRDPGQVDGDGDGVGAACDCDDADPAVGVGVPENCVNGVDDDCDRLVDRLDPDCPGIDLLRNDELTVVDRTTFTLMRGVLAPGGPPALDPVADLFRSRLATPILVDLIDEVPPALPPPHRGVLVFYELSGDGGATLHVDKLDADADGRRDDVRIRE